MDPSEKEKGSDKPSTASKSELENSLATLCWWFSSHFPGERSFPLAETTAIPSPTVWLHRLHTEHSGCQLLTSDGLHQLRAGRIVALLARLGAATRKAKHWCPLSRNIPQGEWAPLLKLTFSEDNQAAPFCWLHGPGNFPGKQRLEALF